MELETLKQIHKYWKDIKNREFMYFHNVLVGNVMIIIGTYLILLNITCIIERKQMINTKTQKGNKEDCVNRKKKS